MTGAPTFLAFFAGVHVMADAVTGNLGQKCGYWCPTPAKTVSKVGKVGFYGALLPQ